MLVLASASPQRRAILEQVGIPFEVRPSDVAELVEGDAEGVAVTNARRKAAAVDGDVVLGCDTVVALDDRLYGKPRDVQDAADTLRALAGRTHTVVSGLCVREGEVELLAAVRTAVTFRAVDERLLVWYLARGEWRGRAGAYAIQGAGAALVARIDGDYLNVVGLPLARLLDLRPGLLGAGR